MLSLDKTKEVARLKEFVGDQTAVISWKMDGSDDCSDLFVTASFLRQFKRKWEVGEVITNNAKVF